MRPLFLFGWLWVSFISVAWTPSVMLVQITFEFDDLDICFSLLIHSSPGGQFFWPLSDGIMLKWWHQHVASLPVALTKCCVISTAIGVTSSLYSQIIFCMTLVRSSFSVSLTMCRSACITGRMKGVMYSLAKENATHELILETFLVLEKTTTKWPVLTRAAWL